MFAKKTKQNTGISAQAVDESLSRAVTGIYPSKQELQSEILSGRRLRIYLGVDPTGQHLHLGHLTNFLVLKRLQLLGQEIIFLIGDFTARIGDPTDKMAPRQPLTEIEVKQNMRTFKEQVSRIISFSGENPAQIKFNSSWYEKMSLKTFMREMLGYFTVQNLLHRKGFKERIEKDALHLQEFIYPLLQGYDGVAMDVDVEVGGNDQIFNMNIGRALRKANVGARITRQGEKFLIATKLLENPKTGKKLMNKSEGGMINLDDSPEDIFGKVMSLDDAAMFSVAEFSTEMPMAKIDSLKKEVASGKMNPRDAKAGIAEAVVMVIYGEKAAGEARESFRKIFSKKEVPADAPELSVKKKISVLDLVLASGAMKSKSEARRLIEQGGVEVHGAQKKDPNEVLEFRGGENIRIGKKRFFRIKL